MRVMCLKHNSAIYNQNLHSTSFCSSNQYLGYFHADRAPKWSLHDEFHATNTKRWTRDKTMKKNRWYWWWCGCSRWEAPCWIHWQWSHWRKPWRASFKEAVRLPYSTAEESIDLSTGDLITLCSETQPIGTTERVWPGGAFTDRVCVVPRRVPFTSASFFGIVY